MAKDAFSTGTIGDAYVRMLRALFEPLGMAVLDSSHAAVRAAARPHLQRALERALAVSSAATAAAKS